DLSLFVWQRCAPPGIFQGSKERTAFSVFCPITSDYEKVRCIWRSHDVAQQDGAVPVSPLEVINKKNHPVSVTESRQQFAERRRRRLPEFGRIRIGSSNQGCFSNARNSP